MISFEKIIYGVKFCTKAWIVLKNGVQVAGFVIPAGSYGDLYHGHMGAIVQWNIARVAKFQKKE